MGTAESKCRNNNDFVDNLIEAGILKSSKIEKAFRAVDRANYILEKDRENAYKDKSWRRGKLYISAPSVDIKILEKLELSPGLSFLNLGSGTGYLSTIAGVMLGKHSFNEGIEFDVDVMEYAINKLKRFSKSVVRMLNRIECTNPYFGGEEYFDLNTSYDRVFCGRACPIRRIVVMKKLMKIGGILVLTRKNDFLKITRTSKTTWDKEVFLPDYTKIDQTNEPQPLREICRSQIRRQLSQKIYNEHASSIGNTPKQANKKRCIIIPTYEETDLKTNPELMENLHEIFDISDSEENPYDINKKRLLCTGEVRIYYDPVTGDIEEGEPPEPLTRWSYASHFDNLMRAAIQELPVSAGLKSYLNRD